MPGGPLPLWLFDRRRRVAGTSLKEYLAAASLALAGPDETVADALSDRGPLWHRFWVPLTVAALNTPPAEASAELLWSLMKGTFLKGAQACRPLIAKDSLAESLINPAVTYLESKGAELHLNCRLRQIRTEMNRVVELNMAHRPIPVTAEERVILALPPLALKAFLPHLDIPQEVSAIVNAHYLLPGEPGPNCALTRRLPFLGMVGGTADWLFLREDVASITVSAADDLAAHENKGIAEALWHDTAKALDMAEKPLPPHRILKEKRATFRQTPEALKCRPGPDIGFANLFISGDWTDTGFPATIESAIKSGKIAASKCKVTLS
ncbi:MAG: FAD-dependent oxidoreductase [Kiloniellales bacterium]|nr:FAD-dependent oxidoreductase [Kiloniellales bacterium]